MKSYLIALLLSVLVLTFAFAPLTGSQITPQYDSWLDINDDGSIDMADISILIINFMSHGTPINKTQLLLEILEKIDSLNSSLQDLEAYVKTQMPKRGSIIISPIEFQPEESSQSYYKSHWTLYGFGVFLAAVHLPNEATITCVRTRVTDDTTSGYVYLGLYREDLSHGCIPMAEMWTTEAETTHDIILYDNTIEDAVIDNDNNFYFLILYLSESTMFLSFLWTIIDYEYPS